VVAVFGGDAFLERTSPGVVQDRNVGRETVAPMGRNGGHQRGVSMAAYGEVHDQIR
jgi:hypothetical protein